MTRTEWIDAISLAFARSMPDEFPEGYARWLAEQKADAGAYDAYVRGEFRDDVLYEPRGGWA